MEREATTRKHWVDSAAQLGDWSVVSCMAELAEVLLQAVAVEEWSMPTEPADRVPAGHVLDWHPSADLHRHAGFSAPGPTRSNISTSARTARVDICSSAWADLVSRTGAVVYQEGRAA